MKVMDKLKERIQPLTVKEAAEIYGDSIGEFYRKIRRGEIPGVFRPPGNPRGRIKICTPIFLAWIEEQVAASSRSPKTMIKSVNGNASGDSQGSCSSGHNDSSAVGKERVG